MMQREAVLQMLQPGFNINGVAVSNPCRVEGSVTE
jgi:hypothetical protein